MAEEAKKENIEQAKAEETPKEEVVQAAEAPKEEAPKQEEKPSAEAELKDKKEADQKEEGKEKEAQEKKFDKKGGKHKRRPRQERPREQKEFEEQVLQISRVSRMMKGGRRMSFQASVVIGDKKGRVGFGIGKANEVQGAVQKAVRKARKGLITVNMKDERTLPHRLDHKFKAARVRIMPASAGTGVIAGGTIRTILELAGVKDCLSKNIGTTNKITIAKATIEALEGLRK